MLRNRTFLKKVHHYNYNGRRWSSSLHQVPLYEPFPYVPKPKYAPHTPEVEFTITGAGVRVATLFHKSPVVSMSYFVNAGSRYETPNLLGASFFLSLFAHKSTKGRSSLRVVRESELIGAQYSASSEREYVAYSSQFLSDAVEQAHSHLSDVLFPRLEEFELREVRHVAPEILDELESNCEQTALELAHQEAFRNRGLGNPLHALRHRIDQITIDDLVKYHQQHFTPSNITLVAVGGVNHAALVEKVEQTFPHTKKIPVHTKMKSERPSEYFGGNLRIWGDGPTHIVLGYKGVSYDNPKSVTLGVLQHLIGGSVMHKSKPGAGFHSPLGNLVSSFPVFLKGSTFNFNYSDNGFFGVSAVVNGEVDGVIHKLASIFKSVSNSPPSPSHLERAKAQFKLHSLNANRSSLLKSLYQQAQISKELSDPRQVSKQIDSVTAQDVQSLAKELFSSSPTLVVVGDIHNVPLHF
jgi:predicted Zn-dependent peptidase